MISYYNLKGKKCEKNAFSMDGIRMGFISIDNLVWTTLIFLEEKRFCKTRNFFVGIFLTFKIALLITCDEKIIKLIDLTTHANASLNIYS